MASCTVPAVDQFGQRRVSEQEIQQITPVINKATYHTSESIGGFYRERSGDITVVTNGRWYTVRRIGDSWKIVGASEPER
jgi:hypothetical protein